MLFMCFTAVVECNDGLKTQMTEYGDDSICRNITALLSYY